MRCNKTVYLTVGEPKVSFSPSLSLSSPLQLSSPKREREGKTHIHSFLVVVGEFHAGQKCREKIDKSGLGKRALRDELQKE